MTIVSDGQSTQPQPQDSRNATVYINQVRHQFPARQRAGSKTAHYFEQQMKPSQVVALLTYAIAVTGCATGYQEPTQTNAATLTLRTAGDFTAQAAIYSGAAECTDRHLLPVMDGKRELSRRIAPGAPLSFSMTYSKNMLLVVRYCVDTVTFTPAADHHYAASLAITDGQCHIDVTDLGTDNASLNPPVPVKTEHHTWTRAMTESGPFCGS
ncbi:hypothetical protein [Paraburkholderia phosphatilytica]|uniref:hypothetical protein n=1 Tax=Paraburkholderia phosphatilytica TaxID=2282883 RepID=UPI000F5F26E4|nr:hypothetical protein [Paraburkholderia phosphatilytica]